MSAPVTAFASFKDLKKNVAFEGGFSDGGVECFSLTLTTAGVDIAPRPGTSFGGFSMLNEEGAPWNPNFIAFNFDQSSSVLVQTQIVTADGTVLDGPTSPAVPAAVPAEGYSGIPLQGLIVSHPNKLRFKLVADGTTPLPTKRVLLKGTVLVYDKPSDLG